VVDNNDQSVFVVYINLNRLFVKKYDRYGDPLWGGNRITLADTTEIFGRFSNNIISQWGAVVPDDSGGLFVSWVDYRFAIYDEFDALTNDIYIQYVDRNGIVKMEPNGKRLNTLRDQGHRLGDMKTDYRGGVFIGISADTSRSTCVLKRILNDGSVLWERSFDETVVDVCASNPQGEVFINIISQLPGRRQKLDIIGNSLWPDTLHGMIPDLISYRSGRAFNDRYGGVYGMSQIGTETRYNQILSTGERVYGDGITLPAPFPAMYFVTDDNQGVYYQSASAGGDLKHVLRDGSVAWSSDTVKFCPNSGCGGVFGIVPDGTSGVIGLWSLGVGNPGFSFHVQRIDSSAQKLWKSDGVKVHNSPHEIEPVANSIIPMVSDGRGGVVFSWVLSNLGLQIYIKQVSSNGFLGEVITRPCLQLKQ